MSENEQLYGSDEGLLVTMNLADTSQLADQLQKVIARGIQLAGTTLDSSLTKVGKSIDETSNNYLDAIENIQSTNVKAINQAMEIVTQSNNQLLEQLKAQKKTYDEILASSGGSKLYGNDESKFGKFIRAIQLMTGVAKITKKAFDKIVEKVSEPAKIFQNINDAGIRLVNGFDQSVWKLSNQAGLKIEEFTELMAENNRYVNSLTLGNKFGGEDSISKGFRSIVGLMGTSERQAKSIVKYFNETMLESQDLRNMTSEEYTRQLRNTTQHLQELSKATGLSVQQIIEKNKLDENDIVMKKLQQKDFDAFTTLRTLGFTPEKIKYIMLGTMSKQIAETMALNPREGALLRDAHQAYQTGGSNYLDKILSSGKYGKNPIDEQMLQVQSYADTNSPLQIVGDNIILNNVEGYKGKGSLSNAEKTDIYNYNSALKAQQKANELYNTWLEATTVNLQHLAGAASKVEWSLNQMAKLIPGSGDGGMSKIMPWVGPGIDIVGDVAGTYIGYKTLQKLAGKGGEEAAKKLGYFSGMKQRALSTAKSAKVIGGSFAAGLIAAGMEGYDQYQRVSQLSEYKDAGLMSETEYKDERNKGIGATVGSGVGAGLGAWGGAIAGQALIPIPIVGALIGAAAGAWGGEALGNLLGEKAGDAFISDDTYQQSNITNPNYYNEQMFESLYNQNEANIIARNEQLELMQSIRDNSLSEQTFVNRVDILISKTEETLKQLKAISGKDFSLTELAVASQSR